MKGAGMQQTRRQFLRNLLATVATGVLVKGGVVQPEQVIAEPKRRVFDMAENTWRQPWHVTFTESARVWQYRWSDIADEFDRVTGLRPEWPIEWTATISGEWYPEHVNCRCITGYEPGTPVTAKWDGFEATGTIKEVSIAGGLATVRMQMDKVYSIPILDAIDTGIRTFAAEDLRVVEDRLLTGQPTRPEPPIGLLSGQNV